MLAPSSSSRFISKSSATPNVSTESLYKFISLPLHKEMWDKLFRDLRYQIDWQTEGYVAFDRYFKVPRLQAWYADPDVHYRNYSNLLTTQAWLEPLADLRRLICNITGLPFNSVLATYYRSGLDHVRWHSDDETELGESPIIASLSFGSVRKFEYRKKGSKQPAYTFLNHGDCLIMLPAFQKHWEHQVPVEPYVTGDRINLTFRNIVA